jgi:hypothetical protein
MKNAPQISPHKNRPTIWRNGAARPGILEVTLLIVNGLTQKCEWQLISGMQREATKGQFTLSP